MASVNRYTKIAPARYTPRTLQEMMITPGYKRQQHDTLDEQLSATETALAQVDPLDVHSERAKAEQQKLYDQLSKQAEQLGSEGFTPTSKSDFTRLNKQYQQAISPTGDLGKIQEAKKVMGVEKDTYIKNATKEGYSPTAAEANWNTHLADYAKKFDETGEVSSIGALYAPKYHDVVQEAKELFKSAGFDQNTLYNDLGTDNIIQTEDGMYKVTSKGYKKYGSNIKQLQSALDYMNNQINNVNSEVYQSLIHQGKTPESALREIEGLGEVFTKTTSDQASGKTFNNYAPANTVGLRGDGNASYDTTSAENIKRFDDDFSKKLLNISGEVDIDVLDTSSKESAARARHKQLTYKKGPATVANSLTKSQKEEYDFLYDVLKDDNPILLVSDKYSPEAAAEINEYLEGTTDLLRQNFIIQDDFVKEYGTSTGATKSKADIDKYIKTNLSDQTFGYNGEEYTYSELPENIKKNIFNAKYSGYLSPKNFEGFQKESNKDLYVSPHVYELYDEDTGKIEKLYVGRKAGERNTPEFQADRMFNKVYQTAKFRPKITHRIKGLGATIKYFQGKEDYINTPPEQLPSNYNSLPDKGMYILTDNKTGARQSMDEVSLQNAIYTASGAK